MTLDAKNPTIEDDELSTTAPNPPEEVWTMPEPVFRKTSGKLPQGFVKKFAPAVDDEADETPPVDDPVESAPPESAPEPKPSSPVLKIILVLLGLGAMIAFIVVFLSVVYFMFLR